MFWYLNKKLVFLFFLMLFFELLTIFALTRLNSLEIFFRGDGRDYQNLANDLINHQTFAITSQPPFLPTSFRTPIYPFWLAFIYLIFQSYNAAIFIGAAIFVLSAPIVYLIGKEIFPEKIAFLSAVIFAVEPWALFQAGFIAAEQIFMPIFLFSVYLFCLYLKYGKTSNLHWSSFLLAIAALIRPIALYFIAILIFLAFILEFKKSFWRSLKVSTLAFLMFIAVLSPWFIRNKFVLGTWQFSSASGLSVFNDYFMLERYLGRIDSKEDIYEKAKQLTGASNDIEAITTVENSKKLSDFAVKGILSYPYAFLTMHFLEGVPLFLVGNSYSNILFDLGLVNRGLKIFLFLFWPFVILLAVWGIYRKFRNNKHDLLLWLLVLWILYFSFLTASARDVSRYKLAINAPLFMLAVFGFYKIKNYFFGYVPDS